ncbi:ATP-binding protein [Actinomadura sp. ATCC 31491]|uniref:ATP-binding protein n=1 Tax=Actinomadura luzonensis TaxID=2805427 RepID=A0ABT0G8K4_9ACTN|nr:AAA family ATPase [Actinomadura luzonensis]MCK2220590.1 ATP-binding protein [Actinomadura luzonensis]
MLDEGARTGTVRYPPGSLVILTGLPGAGKTTLLRRLYALDGAESLPVAREAVTVIDTYQAKRHWAGRLAWAPHPVRRAVVFATHLSRISRALADGRSVVAHNRGCAPSVLRGLDWLARRHGARLHLLLLDTTPEAALAGQRERGRVVAARTFARHRRRWEELMARVRNGDPAPAAAARVVDRGTAALLEAILFEADQDPVSGGFPITE